MKEIEISVKRFYLAYRKSSGVSTVVSLQYLILPKRERK